MEPNYMGTREALKRLSYGVYVITTRHRDEINGFTASWVSQVSLKPPLIMACVGKRHVSYPMIKEGGVFVVNILGKEQKEFSRLFSVPFKGDEQVRVGVPYKLGRVGAPILDEAAAYFECMVLNSVEAGDHMMFIAEVVDGDVRKDIPTLTTDEVSEYYGG